MNSLKRFKVLILSKTLAERRISSMRKANYQIFQENSFKVPSTIIALNFACGSVRGLKKFCVTSYFDLLMKKREV